MENLILLKANLHNVLKVVIEDVKRKSWNNYGRFAWHTNSSFIIFIFSFSNFAHCKKCTRLRAWGSRKFYPKIFLNVKVCFIHNFMIIYLNLWKLGNEKRSADEEIEEEEVRKFSL
jgi:hypothetical protein